MHDQVSRRGTDITPVGMQPRVDCLRNINISVEYRTGDANLVREFYVPCLSVASSYDRAVGYFTSQGLALAGQGLSAFSAKGGRMRLVASPVLSAEDVDAISRGLAARASVVERRLLEALAKSEDQSDFRDLALLVATDRLDVRLAVPINGSGIYHEKCGVFTDSDGCQVAFAGSANETIGGLADNFESVDVFFSWDSTRDRVGRKVDNFERLWNNQTPSLEVMDLPTTVRRRLLEIASEPAPAPRSDSIWRREPAAPTGFHPPHAFALRDYQEQAVEAWVRSGFRGVFAMATGTGKTVTALASAVRLAEHQSGRLAIVINVPYIHLVDQWEEECRRWGLRPVKCYESAVTWRAKAWRMVDDYRSRVRDTVCLITTGATSLLPEFQRVCDSLAAPALLIADEVHHLGSDAYATALRQQFGYRLGVSATPTRWHDEEGTERIAHYFGPVVFDFGISAAIQHGVLCPYRYFPILVPLDAGELRQYGAIIDQLEALKGTRDSAPEVTRLLTQRFEIVNLASGKIGAFIQMIDERPPSRTLIYCASREQLGAAADALESRQITYRAFTAEEDSATRRELLADFESARVQTLLAMRALDEGVDIPNTREAHILASSANPLEFIQRRGRVLRRAIGKTHAAIFDYVVVPEVHGEVSRAIAERELTRVLAFSSAATNADSARETVMVLLDRFDLLHLIAEKL